MVVLRQPSQPVAYNVSLKITPSMFTINPNTQINFDPHSTHSTQSTQEKEIYTQTPKRSLSIIFIHKLQAQIP